MRSKKKNYGIITLILAIILVGCIFTMTPAWTNIVGGTEAPTGIITVPAVFILSPWVLIRISRYIKM